MDRIFRNFICILMTVIVVMSFAVGASCDALYPVTSPFYGVWCSASRSESDAQSYADWLKSAGFPAQVFVTTDWSNLNTEPWYVVTAGICGTEQEAGSVLSSVRSVVPDAYVKYSGFYKGSAYSQQAAGNTGWDNSAVNNSAVNNSTVNNSAVNNNAVKNTEIASAVDTFIVNLMYEAFKKCYQNGGYSRSSYCDQVTDLYVNGLSQRQKYVIAASNTNVNEYHQYYETEIGVMDQPDVQRTYIDLFGEGGREIDLPLIEHEDDFDSYYLDYARDVRDYVYSVGYEKESEVDITLLAFDKISSEKQVIQKQYDFYSHWGNKQNGKSPEGTINAYIFVTANNTSSFGYNITDLNIIVY